MKRNITIIILSVLTTIFIISTAILYSHKNQRTSVSNQQQTNNSVNLPSDPFAVSIPAGILASKYPANAQFIQEIQNQLGTFGIDEILPDPANPKRIYYTYTTNGHATQIQYYDPADDKTYDSLHWPIIQNGSVSLTTGLTNIPAGQTAHPVDVIGDKFIYAVSSFADRANLDDPCESLILHYEHTPMFLIDGSGKITVFIPDSSLIAAETQKQQQCRTH